MNDNIIKTSTISLFHNDKWQLNFSNLPTINSMRDMKIYDLYVKSLTFPDYIMDQMFSDGRGIQIRHPVGGIKENFNLSPLVIEFKLIEDMSNYLYLFQWMKSLKYGEVENFNTHEEFFRKNTIKSINLSILDNEKRVIAIWRFTQALLLNLSSISLVQGISDEVTFSCNFSYEEILFETKDINSDIGN